MRIEDWGTVVERRRIATRLLVDQLVPRSPVGLNWIADRRVGQRGIAALRPTSGCRRAVCWKLFSCHRVRLKAKRAGSSNYVPCGTELSFEGGMMGSASSKIHSRAGPFVAVAIPSSVIHSNVRSGASPVITRRPWWCCRWWPSHYAGRLVMPGSDGLPTTMKDSARHNHRPFRNVSSASSGRNRPLAAWSGVVRLSARSFMERSASRYICVVSMDS